MKEKILGINPVLEALKSHPERIQEIFLPVGTLKGRKGIIYSLARSHNIKVQRVPHNRFERLTGTASHQGVIGVTLPYAYRPLEELLENWRKSQERALFVLLDGIEDPRNLGAIARTANTAGAHGIIVPKHRSAPVNTAAAKAAAGAFSYTPVCRITNLVATIKRLKKEGVWVVGTAPNADLSLYAQDFRADTAVVIGGEGKGLHSLVEKNCDFLVSIPTRGNIDSLNAAVATGVVLYEIIRQRQEG
jgi:23S rRNA (guanosine2251-2'-O)-methyltransferase